jgi:uncharacterized protein YndB with AHSA1/START domain
MEMKWRLLFAAAATALAGGAAQAEASNVSASGFFIQHRSQVQATPAQVWQALAQVGRWWNSQHSWSGQAANMSIDLNAGGCFCERWAGGHSVMHGQVVFVQSGSVLRLNANLGPLQELGTSGVLTFVIGVTEGKTQLRVSYRVWGVPDLALDKLAAPVDGMIGEQVSRLVKFIETGKAD